jgi:transposase
LWADPTGTNTVCRGKKSYTRRFAWYITDLLQFMTIKDVSKNLGLHWNTVKDIEKQKLVRKYKKIDLRGVKHIAIDEFAIRKGHVYQTVVMDLMQSRIIYVAKDREMSSLDNFWKMVDRCK